ncbi:MAG: hypothetical protein BroJett040_20100 [Oligoflexia bacterium]|nr:MAG: hypothetical protein BroJett040_20100 [Oligoflexia bacterium]
MGTQTEKRFSVSLVWGIIATLFGLMTIKEGASVLFFDGPSRAAAGNYVPFVLMFNFLAGFFYAIAGLAIIKKKNWAQHLAAFLGISSALTFAFLGFHISNGGLFEMRTVYAMTLRTSFWILTFVFLYLQNRKGLSHAG